MCSLEGSKWCEVGAAFTYVDLLLLVFLLSHILFFVIEHIQDVISNLLAADILALDARIEQFQLC